MKKIFPFIPFILAVIAFVYCCTQCEERFKRHVKEDEKEIIQQYKDLKQIDSAISIIDKKDIEILELKSIHKQDKKTIDSLIKKTKQDGNIKKLLINNYNNSELIRWNDSTLRANNFAR